MTSIGKETRSSQCLSYKETVREKGGGGENKQKMGGGGGGGELSQAVGRTGRSSLGV